MSAVKKLDKPSIDSKILKSLTPLKRLSPQQIKEISSKASVIDLARGRTLFIQGDNDNSTFFLISGEMEFLSGDSKIAIKGGSKKAKCALFDVKPRPVTAKAKSKVSVLCIDSGLLEIMLSDYNQNNYEVSEIEGEDNRDWMTIFIQSLTAMNLPASNMQALMMRMRQIEVSSGDVVIKQFDHDEFYYIVKQGRCAVSRKASSQGADIRLAELGAGDGFGEEALIANEERSATVRMLDDGVLMRLEKKDFLELLSGSVLTFVTYDEASSMIKSDACFLDVRNVSEHTRDGISDSLNIPLAVLRFKLAELDNRKKYIVYCDDEGKSSAAAFLLTRAGYQSVVLKNGLTGVPQAVKIKLKRSNVATTAGGDPKDVVPVADVISLLPYETELHNNQGQGRDQKAIDSAWKLKKTHRIAENVPDDHELIVNARLKTEKEQEKAKKAIKDKELAEAETDRLRAEINQINERLKQKDIQSSRAEAELQLKLDEEKQRARQALTEQKESSQFALEQELETQLKKVKKQSERELAELASNAQSLHAKFLEESRKVRANEEALQRAENELDAVLIENEKVSSDNEALSKKIETERAHVVNVEQAHKKALAENEQLKTEINDAQIEAKLQLEELLEQNSKKLETELTEIKETMQDEKNKAFLAEKALRKAKEVEAQLKAEAEAARIEAEKNARKIAQIQNEKIRELEEEVERAEEAEAAQLEAEAMAEQLKFEAEQAKKRAVDEARKYEEAETARLEAIEKSKKNVQMAAIARERAEKGTSQLRAEIEAARISAEEALNKSTEAEDARRAAEEEIRKQAEIVEAMKRADEEQERAFMSEQARKKAEEEVGKLKAKLLAQKKAALARQRSMAKVEKKKRLQQKQVSTPGDNFAANDSVIIAPEHLLGKKETADANVGSVRKSGWISDALLWETTLGLREDAESEEYLADKTKKEPSPKRVQATKSTAKKKANPNATVFEARELGNDPTITNRNIQFQESSASRRASSTGKKIFIGSFVSILLAVGVGFYVTWSGDGDQLPNTISNLLDNKTKERSKEAALAVPPENITANVDAGVEGQLIEKNNIKILMQQAELKARTAADAEFSRLKAKTKVVVKSPDKPAEPANNTVDAAPSVQSVEGVQPEIKDTQVIPAVTVPLNNTFDTLPSAQSPENTQPAVADTPADVATEIPANRVEPAGIQADDVADEANESSEIVDFEIDVSEPVDAPIAAPVSTDELAITAPEVEQVTAPVIAPDATPVTTPDAAPANDEGIDIQGQAAAESSVVDTPDQISSENSDAQTTEGD